MKAVSTSEANTDLQSRTSANGQGAPTFAPALVCGVLVVVKLGLLGGAAS